MSILTSPMMPNKRNSKINNTAGRIVFLKLYLKTCLNENVNFAQFHLKCFRWIRKSSHMIINRFQLCKKTIILYALVQSFSARFAEDKAAMLQRGCITKQTPTNDVSGIVLWRPLSTAEVFLVFQKTFR